MACQVENSGAIVHLHKKMMIFSKKRMMKTKTIRYKINEETKNGVRKEKMIMFDLTGNVAVVTGASAGLLDVSLHWHLQDQGADVAVLARRKEKLEGVAEEIRALGVKCLPVQCDVTQIDQIQSAVDEVVKGLGTVDILVNNAGGGSCIPLEDLPDEEWRKVLFARSGWCILLHEVFRKSHVRKRIWPCD